MNNICLLFLTYSNITHIDKYDDYLENCNIYIHPKYPEKVNKSLKKYIIPKLIETKWAEKSIINATLELLKESHKNKENNWFILCSEDMFPLVTYEKLSSYLKNQQYSIFDVMDESKNKTSQFWALKRDDVDKILLNKDKWNTIFDRVPNPKKAAIDEEFFLPLLKLIKPNYQFTNSKFCYVKWFKNFISKHPTTFNCLLQYDLDIIEKNHSCFVRKTYPTFQNILCPDKPLSILLVYGSESISDYSEFLNDFSKIANIFILSMVGAVNNSQLTNECCQTYYVTWNDLENSIKEIKKFLTGNLIVTSEKLDVNILKNMLIEEKMKDKNNNEININFNINNVKFFFDEYMSQDKIDENQIEEKEKDKENDTQPQDIELNLQLGDIIRISNPVNEILNDQIFIIDYIDSSKTYLINTDTLNRIKLKITEDGILGDGNIRQIEILRRADTPSYARQNGLVPGKWIKIYFADPTPAIIVGEITNLEQDMIELRTTDKDIIYINFDYKGIPENLPIDNIEIIQKPIEKTSVEEDLYIPQLEEDKKAVDAEEIEVVVPVKDVKDQLREIILKADQVVFGEEDLGPLIQFKDVSTQKKIYSIEEQVNDLLDDLLSTIPDAQRTPRVLNNIHIMIERFKQLRQKFSHFDQYGNVDGIIVNEASWKPLSVWLQNFNKNLYWILPVVRNIKKIYNIENIDEENNDIIILDTNKDIKDMSNTIKTYMSSDLPAGSNKYTALYSDLAQYFRPFEYPEEDMTNDIIGEKYVESDLNVVIENLEEFYSSVFSNNMVRNRRFVTSKYLLASTKLEATDITSAKMTTVRVKISDDDFMSIRSIMTLPEPTIRFSRINLPGTDILTKANLGQIFLNYWELLKKKTSITNIFVESFENKLELDENEFVSGIRNYVANVPYEELNGLSKSEFYKKYVETIVPKTRILFNLMKKYIKGKLSIVDVVGYLEPFLIYTDDLTFNQYSEIVAFVDAKISEYNKQMIEFSKIFKLLSTIKQQPLTQTKAFSILTILSRNYHEEVLESGYQLSNPTENVTNSEILRKLLIKDYSRLYTSAISHQNLKLMYPSDVSDIFDVEKKKNEDKLKKEENENTCENITIAKLYTSLEQLNNDNDTLIYFDKKYDKTNYGLMEEENKKGGYAEQLINMSPENLKDYITRDQMKKNNMTETDAAYIADTLIDGAKKVIDGQYAILYKGYSEQVEFENDYYVRKNNKWIIDKELSSEQKIIDESSIICDLQEKCISVPTKTGDNCQSMKTTELNLQNTLLKNIISEFDTKYKFSKEKFEKEITDKFNYFMSIMPIVSKIETNFLLKYNNEKYKLGVTIEDDFKEQIVSPFSELLNMILRQSDFVKKQNDILKFANKFTRPCVPGMSPIGKQETEHWLYCIKTNAPLLPTFKKTLADAFIKSQSNNVYIIALDKIKSTNGQLSDDGDWWTDKYTGWPICPGDFDVEEGYDEGFKIVSRSVIEEEAGNKIMASTSEKTIKYITPETIMINNIVNALSVAMGINIESQKEFIINSVVETIKTNVESESDYKEKIKTAKKDIPSYKDFFNTFLLYSTLGMYLIAVQSSIPSVKTRKTHPGCVRSFTGYPFEGQGDYSSVAYLACITYDIRGAGEPWNALKKTNAQKIQTKIQSFIDTILIQLPDVQRKFVEKTEYLLTNPASDIPAEHDISKWSDFLPPLIPFKIRHLTNISKEFKSRLVSDLRSGSENQREKILVVESKIIQFSLAIQEMIQDIVKKHRILLHTANNEPYLENACCDSKDNESTFNYFNSRNGDILEFNKIVEDLSNILDDIRGNTESLIFYSNINTKNVYPSIPNTFNEKTVYLAFIFYCKFKSLLPIPEDLLPICTSKPDSGLIDPSDTIERVIQKLKEDGRNYTNEQFLRLISLVSRENIANVDISNPVISCIAKLSELLEVINDENNDEEVIDVELRDLIRNAIDTFDIATETTTPQVKELNNYLFEKNEEMTKELIDFVKTNAGSLVTRSSIRNFTNAMQNLSNWICDTSTRNEDNKISNDNMYNVTNFYKTFINNFANIFPNIIMNKVDYDFITIPNYYGFSKIHSSKLRKNVTDYFEKLKPFYGYNSISKTLIAIQKLCKNITKLAESTPCFSSIKNNNKILKGIIDERTSRYLFEHYLLKILFTYIELTDNKDMIVTETKIQMEVANIFSVDYVEELDTRVDVQTSYRSETDTRIQKGNLRQLREEIARLLISFVDILTTEKDIIDITYEEIQDRVFKLKEREKDMVTDKLKAMTDEGRDIDTVLKITKQGLYSKGLQKGLTIYEKEFYERKEEQELRDEMEKAERKIRRKNKDAVDENIDILVDEYLEQSQVDADIEDDAYDMAYLGEDYYDGNYTGIDAPEYETYGDED
jgi:hypothetical protein